ncbi:MAG: hypothetical protein ACT4PS_11130 [Betaproteobacteria bacterium]
MFTGTYYKDIFSTGGFFSQLRPEHVEARRREVGLEPLEDRLAREQPAPLPRDRARFARDYEAWLRRVGWRQ